jgi:hypothetical protein
VFSRLRQFNLKLQPEKCFFLKRELAFLGHVVGEDGIQPDEAKIITVKTFPIPKNQKQLKGFLGLASYYRKFIKNFSSIAEPLLKLLRKDIKFHWSEQCNVAFQDLKSCLTQPPVLMHPDFNKIFIITCDASNSGIGCVLSQMHNVFDKPIAFSSRVLNKA